MMGNAAGGEDQLGEPDMDRREVLLESIPETNHSDPMSASTGRQVPESSSKDEDDDRIEPALRGKLLLRCPLFCPDRNSALLPCHPTECFTS